jgi:hypothetical protein
MVVVPLVVPFKLTRPVVLPCVPTLIFVAKVGAVPKTSAPVPVSPVTAVIKSDEEKEPREDALPTEVIAPVRLALVMTVAAFPTEVTPPVRLALVVTVAALPVVEPEEPETLPVTFPVKAPVKRGETTLVPK